MTPKQRTYIFGTLWREACKWQGWSPSDRDRRLQEVQVAVGHPVESMSSLDQDEITAVIQHFGVLGYNLDAAIDQGKGNGKTRQYAWKCRNYYWPRIAIFMCSGNFRDDVFRSASYIGKILRDRFQCPPNCNVFNWIAEQDEIKAKQIMITLAGAFQRVKKRYEEQAGKEMPTQEVDTIAAHIAAIIPEDEQITKARDLVFKMAPRSIIEDCVTRIFGDRPIHKIKDLGEWRQIRNALAADANKTRNAIQQPATA